MQRARIHCLKCAVMACNLCGPYYFNTAVPVAPAAPAPFFPEKLIQEQQYYIMWCEGEMERLKKELENYKQQVKELELEKAVREDFAKLDKGKGVCIMEEPE